MLPWLAIRRGRPVSPTGLGEGGRELRDLISTMLKEYGKLLLWDVDGMERGRPDLALYRKFEGKGLWVDEGVQSVGDLMDVLVAGAEVAVLNVKTFPSLEGLQIAGEMMDKLAICVEETQGALTRDPYSKGMLPPDFFRVALQAGIRKGIYIQGAGLQEAPGWSHALEDSELYWGPARPPGEGEQASIGVLVDVYELM